MIITDPMGIYYLTGRFIDPFERMYALYLNNKGNHSIFINILETVPEDLGVEKIWFSDTDPYLDYLYKAIDHNAPLGIDKLMSAKFFLPLMHQNVAPTYEISSGCVDRARAIKDQEEIKLMIKASQINDEAMDIFKHLVNPELSEIDLASKFEDVYKSLGADTHSFSPLVAYGGNAANGHHSGSSTMLKAGDCVLLDVGCKYKGYCSDMTRTFFYKEVSKKNEEIYNLVRRANESAEALVAPGIALHTLDDTARNIIGDGGYRENFTHRLGHFIGMEVHDFGDVSATATDLTQTGNIFSIEPGIYVEGEVGVRIEDLVLVTEDGVNILNQYPKELEILD